jgi:S1-C subfamily serine protease
MLQGDFIRPFSMVVAAGAGAGLALGGAAITGNLGNTTTIQQIVPAGSQAASTLPSVGGTLSVEQIYRLDAPGVVQINTRAYPSPLAQGLGTGFVIDKAGHIITNNRVISGARSVKVSFSGNEELNATVIGADPTTDVAVLQIKTHARSLSPLPLGDSDLVQVGDPVVAIGNTLALSRTATVGIVSAVQHGVDLTSEDSRSIQTDAAINHANSGGPLINNQGQVIGVSSDQDGNAPTVAGIGFAIPIDTVKSVVAQILQTGTVQHPYLGIDALAISPSLARSFGLPTSYGLIVQSVTPLSGAADAGLRAGRTAVAVAGESYKIGGDIIIAADGVPITTEAQLRDMIESMRPGESLSLQIWRGARKKTVRVKLGEPPG